MKIFPPLVTQLITAKVSPNFEFCQFKTICPCRRNIIERRLNRKNNASTFNLFFRLPGDTHTHTHTNTRDTHNTHIGNCFIDKFVWLLDRRTPIAQLAGKTKPKWFLFLAEESKQRKKHRQQYGEQ